MSAFCRRISGKNRIAAAHEAVAELQRKLIMPLLNLIMNHLRNRSVEHQIGITVITAVELEICRFTCLIDFPVGIELESVRILRIHFGAGAGIEIRGGLQTVMIKSDDVAAAVKFVFNSA